MLIQNLNPEERKEYKQGDFILYDDRPTEEEQQQLLDLEKKHGTKLKKCEFCGRLMREWTYTDSYSTNKRKYCSSRCRNDAYMMRRKQRNESQRHKVCIVCGKNFVAKRKDTLYCSAACKQAAYRNK